MNWLYFILAVTGIVMAHSAADFIDDYFDYQTGNLGNKNKQFHDSPLIDGRVSVRQVLAAITLCPAIALGCGLYLLLAIGLPVLVWTVLGGLIVLSYRTASQIELPRVGGDHVVPGL